MMSFLAKDEAANQNISDLTVVVSPRVKKWMSAAVKRHEPGKVWAYF